MSKKVLFTGAGVAQITPFYSDGSVNYEKLAELLEEQIAGGTDAIIICATTGESATMDDAEHNEVIRFAVERVNHRVPVIAGTGSNDTAYCIKLSQSAEKLGADGLLLVTPYYNKTTQRGLVAHFTAVANSVSLPIILYNIPGRTGMKISIEAYKELAKVENIVATKEASSDMTLVGQILSETDLAVYSGCDEEIVSIMSLGGLGVISVLSNIVPKETHEMAKACLEGDFKKGSALQLKYLDLILSLFCETNPAPIKQAMNIYGKNVGPCRLPLYIMEDKNIERLSASMKKVGLLK